MKFDQFARATGWSAAKASRYAKQGLIRPTRERSGSGNYLEYSDYDVTVASVIDAVGMHADNMQIKALVAEAMYERSPGSVLVIHPPHVEVLDNEQQAANLMAGSTHPEMFTVVKLPSAAIEQHPSLEESNG